MDNGNTYYFPKFSNDVSTHLKEPSTVQVEIENIKNDYGYNY